VRDPLEDWIRKDTALADTFSIEQSAVGVTGFGLQLIEIVQAALAAQVVGGVDHGLDPQRPPVFQILLDAGVLVEGVDGDLGAAGDDLGLELADGVAPNLAVEDDLWAAACFPDCGFRADLRREL
jgi:hypothetical protein